MKEVSASRDEMDSDLARRIRVAAPRTALCSQAVASPQSPRSSLPCNRDPLREAAASATGPPSLRSQSGLPRALLSRRSAGDVRREKDAAAGGTKQSAP